MLYDKNDDVKTQIDRAIAVCKAIDIVLWQIQPPEVKADDLDLLQNLADALVDQLQFIGLKLDEVER